MTGDTKCTFQVLGGGGGVAIFSMNMQKNFLHLCIIRETNLDPEDQIRQ